MEFLLCPAVVPEHSFTCFVPQGTSFSQCSRQVTISDEPFMSYDSYHMKPDACTSLFAKLKMVKLYQRLSLETSREGTTKIFSQSNVVMICFGFWMYKLTAKPSLLVDSDTRSKLGQLCLFQLSWNQEWVTSAYFLKIGERQQNVHLHPYDSYQCLQTRRMYVHTK